MTDPTLDLPNACRLDAKLLTGGQPSRACLEAARAAGFHTIVNLRPPGEFDGFDEAQAVRELGMDYVSIPVAGPDDLDEAAVEALDKALAAAGDHRVLIHCASGNRVGALLALHGCVKCGRAAAEALSYGESAGLTAPPLREAVRRKLESAG